MMGEITPSNPMTALVNLQLDAVALCNEGANSRAHIVLTKAKGKENTIMSFEELMKALQPEQAQVVNDHVASINAAKDKEIGVLTAQVTTLTGEVDTLKKSKPTSQEDIVKSATPELQAYIAELQKSLGSLTAAQEESLLNQRFEKVKALPVEAEELKGILKSASPAVLTVLEKAATAVEGMLKGKGTETGDKITAGDSDAAYAQLEKAATTLQTEKSITFEKAFAMACDLNPKVYAEYVKGVK